MINKRLMALVPESKRYIYLNVLYQWVALIANIALMYALSILFVALYHGVNHSYFVALLVLEAIGAGIIRYFCTCFSSSMSHLSSQTVKKKLRSMIFEKLVRIGVGYDEVIASSEIVQTGVEGVDQLETYFGAYVPQFYYAVLAPVTLFIYMLQIDWVSAVVLLLSVPLIPVSIILVQKWAKKLLSKYWGQYVEMGDSFLENLQGMTDLKIYQADEYRNKVMNEQAEAFRKVTMRVLIMQLNSVSIMDLVAYAGSAVGMIVAVAGVAQGRVQLSGAIIVMLLSAEFFLPMRRLGSYFHVAMNGMAAADRIFAFLDIEEPRDGHIDSLMDYDIGFEHVSFSYDGSREVLHDVSLHIPEKGMVAIVGKSGSGKSTIAKIIAGERREYEGTISVSGEDMRKIKRSLLSESVCYVPSNAYIFKGTVRDNLMEKDDASLWEALEKVNLAGFFKGKEGLETQIMERGSNLSGGQRQRLAMARSLLKDAKVYVLDEATGNIDVESEETIMSVVKDLAKTRGIVLITHRLANAVDAERIYVMDNGNLVEEGLHGELMAKDGTYAKLFQRQKELEDYGKEAIA